MASFLTSIKRELNDDSDVGDVSESQDSFFRRDFDKLKEMLTNLKEVKTKNSFTLMKPEQAQGRKECFIRRYDIVFWNKGHGK